MPQLQRFDFVIIDSIEHQVVGDVFTAGDRLSVKLHNPLTLGHIYRDLTGVEHVRTDCQTNVWRLPSERTKPRTRWIASAIGETVCAVCGAPKGSKTFCCPATSDPVSYETFKAALWGDEAGDVPDSIARIFYSEYRLGNFASIQEYDTATRC